jgi:hypothetical protein
MEGKEVLPDVGISKVIGFLQVLDDHGGSEEAAKLVKELGSELDAFLPIIDASELLGLTTAKNGKIVLTGLGRELVESSLASRRQIFKERMLSLKVFKEVVSLLETRNRRIHRKAILKLLKEKLTHAEAEMQLQRVIDWGRHTEILGYDSDTEELFLLP